MRHLQINTFVLVAAFITSGCVSTGTFEKMQAAKEDEIGTLKQQKAALEQDNSALKQQIGSCEQQNMAMQQQNAAMQQQNTVIQQQNTAMERQVGSLEQQKAALLAASEEQQRQYDALVKSLSTEVERGQLQVRQYQHMLSVELAEQIFFDSGRASLKPGGKAILKKVGEALKDYENKVIRVVGYTDNVPIGKALLSTFPTNWELSVARATTVVRFLQDVGVPPQRMVASGRGEYDPVVGNDTPEGRQRNRRIEIMLIDKDLLSEMQKSLE